MAEYNHRATTDRTVGEALASSASELDDELDPALLARLAAWFDPPPRRSPEEKARQQIDWTRERALAAVDPGFRAHLQRKSDRSADLVRPLPPLEVKVDPGIARFDFEVWGLFVDSEIPEVERPDDIRTILQENTPQAVLRDLHRPVHQPGRVVYEPMSLVSFPGSAHDIALREMGTRHTADMVSLSPSHILRQDRLDRTAILAAPWEDSKPEKPSPLGSSMPTANDMLWFGGGGGD